MPTVRELVESIGSFSPYAKAAAWDPVGLQIGDPDAVVHRVAVCHEVTERVVERLESDPTELLLTYHPLLFRPTLRIVAGPDPVGRALRLARLGIALAVAHTNFDVAPGGAADALGDALGLEDLLPFGVTSGSPVRKVVTFAPETAAEGILAAVAAAGGARIGSYTHCSYRTLGIGTFFAGAGTNPAVGQRGVLQHEPEVRLEFVVSEEREEDVLAALVAAHPYEEPAFDVYDRRGDAGMVGRMGRLPEPVSLSALAQIASRSLHAPALRVAGPHDRRVGAVAVVPGSGGDLIDQAAALRADVLITGDLKHHVARRALDRGLCLIDAGHVPTERPGVSRLLDRARSLGVEAVDLVGRDADPWDPD